MNIQNPPWGKAADAQAHKIHRVMIIDDHEVFRYGLGKLLADNESFRIVAEASNCEDALKRLQTVPVDLVLLDLHLPDVNGIEALHQLKRSCPTLDVIIISATIDDDALLDALLAGASGYLTKDTSAIEMLGALHVYQRGELALSSTVVSRAIPLLLQQCNMLEDELMVYQQNEMKKSPASVPPLASSTTQITDNLLRLLTPQEEKVYQHMRKGHSNKQIAAELYISRFTVGKHVQNILRKLGVTNRTQAVSVYSI